MYVVGNNERTALCGNDSENRKARGQRIRRQSRKKLSSNDRRAIDESPVGRRLGLAGFGINDLFRDNSEIRSCDVGLRTERIEDLSRSGDEGCGASRAKRTHDVPGMRRHESKAINRKAKRVCDRLVCLGRRLEATYGVDRKRAFEERCETGVRELLLDSGRR
jgi:hypothetical protein